MTADDDVRLKLAIYQHFAATAEAPAAAALARKLDRTPDEIREGFARLQAARVLVLDGDGESIRMAPPFSGVRTQHRVIADGRQYYANCAWDALGIPAALRRDGTVHSRCERSGDPLHLDVSVTDAPDSDWLFHCAVPAVHWWKNIVFT